MSYHAVGAEPGWALMRDGSCRPFWGVGEEPTSEVSEAPSMAPPSFCPECSYPEGGSCKWCPDNALDIPGCEGCVGHKRPAPPWYRRSDIIVPMAIAVVTTVVATVATHVTMRRVYGKKTPA